MGSAGTSNEIGESLRRRNNKFAPGSDGVRWKHLKILHRKRPPLLTNLMNACLRYSTFLAEWKEAFVSFIPKREKPSEDAGSYRPISLLSCLGKLLETLIKSRLQDQADEAQYGFRKGRSMENCMHDMLVKLNAMKMEYAYVAVILLDIRGAFDHVYHHRVISEMVNRDVPKFLIALIADYFRGRKVTVATAGRSVDRGCPQGSVLGPALWNVVYDIILRILRLLGVVVFAFADDTLLLIPAQYANELQSRIDVIMELIMEEYKKLVLTLNYDKTAILLFESYPTQLRHDPDWVIDMINIAGHPIEPQSTMKYLGIIFDKKLTFIEHLNYVNSKISKILKKVALVFRNTFGYGNAAQRIMVKGCLEVIYLYASTIWGTALQYQSVVNSIRAAQRKSNTLCARVYKDIRYAVTMVLAGMPPLDLTIEKRNVSYSYKRKYFPIM